jgi:hypothetical protein
MAQSKVSVNKTCADAAALSAWVGNLSSDVDAGKVTGFRLSTGAIEGGIQVSGELLLPAPAGLATAVEDLQE